MSETTMPATEATTQTDERELVSYELAYHVLPTVAEGEVTGVSDQLKKLITTAKGEVFDEEAAERFELAYEIDKYLEGKYRKFTSAYFGWVRFKLEPAALTALTTQIDDHKDLLRYLLVRLTKVEEATPFLFHEALADTKVQDVDAEASEDSDDDLESEEEVSEDTDADNEEENS